MEEAFKIGWGIFAKFVMPWLPGILGSALAWWFLYKGMAFIERSINFAAGVIFMIYFTPVVIELCHITSDSLQDVIKLGLGMSGATIAREAFKKIPEMRLFERMWGVFESLLTRMFGPKP